MDQATTPVRASRVDVAQLRRDAITGAINGPAYVTRCGVFTYVNADGSISRELRHPSEVFAKESLASLRAVPVVEGHPTFIDSTNWRQFTRGHAGDDVAADGSYVAVTLHIQDASTRDAISRGDLQEVSMGYECSVVEDSGVYDGEPYDRRQVGIRYNHVGLGPEGWGRAGANVRLYFDANETENVQYAQGCYGEDMSKLLPVKRADSPEGDGRTSTTRAQAPAAAPAQPPAAQPAAAPPAQQTDAVSRAEFDAMRAELAVTKAQLAEGQQRTKADAAAAEARAGVRVRLDLVRAAEANQIVEGATEDDIRSKIDAMDDDAIRIAVLAKLTPGLKVDGETPEYIRAAFDVAVKSPQAREANLRRNLDGGAPPPGAPAGTNGGYIGSRVDAIRAKQVAEINKRTQQLRSAINSAKKEGV